MKLIFATSNKGKLAEASEILGKDFQLLSSADVGITEDIEETGDTLRANSVIKAEYVYNKVHCDCFADDTGLEVDALGGAPGVHTARYAGDEHDFDANIRKLLSELEGVPEEKRTARFKCVVTLILDGEEHFFEGSMEGRIALQRSGERGFGYDPVFIPDEMPGKTLAEWSIEDKDRISHRGKSLRAMSEWLANRK